MPSPVYLPNPGIELESLALQADSLQTELSGKPYNYQKKKKKIKFLIKIDHFSTKIL